MELTDDITDPRLAKALAHPLRLQILRHLGDRTASPSEIAAEIGAPLTNVSYHVRKLRSLGLIKLVRKTPKRGVIEHYYSAKPRRQVSDGAWAETPSIVKRALTGHSTLGGVEEMIKASESGGWDRSNAHLTRNPMQVDEQGWDETAKVLEIALNDVIKIEERARDRLKETGEDPVIATMIIALFESTRPGGS
jgi:DNA-binding transcriptional ArsR family regulator